MFEGEKREDKRGKKLYCDNKKQKLDIEQIKKDKVNLDSFKSTNPSNKSTSCPRHSKTYLTTNHPSSEFENRLFEHSNLNQKNQSMNKSTKFLNYVDRDYADISIGPGMKIPEIENEFDMSCSRKNSNSVETEVLIIVKDDIIQKPRVFVSNKLALTDFNLEDYCRIVVSYIKNKIGIDHNNFDKYFEILREKKLNVLGDVISDTTIHKFMKIGNIDTSNMRNFNKANKVCQVIALALLNCSNYKCLYNRFKSVSGLQDRQTRDLIKKYIPLLNSINPKLDIKIWMPKKVHTPYTFSDIKSYIQEKGWMLLIPKNQNEFNNLKKNTGGSDISLIVHCGNPEHLEWKSSFRSILNNNSNCPDCSNNVCTYSQIKQIVKILGSKMSDKEGILIQPESNEKFLQIRRNKGRQPSYITIIVSCENQKHKSWKTNAVNLSQERWCRECYLERNTKYDFETIKTLIESKSGTLIYPTSQEKYEELFNRLKNIKLKHNSPSDLPIEVSCNKGHIPFTTTPDKVAQNHWCPLCGERYSVVGTLIHPIFEFIFLRLFLLKKCNAKYEKKIFSDKKRLVDLLIKRDKNFIGKIENKQHTLIVPDYINFLIIDFTIGRNLRNIIDHCKRGYQSNYRLLIIVLLRFRDQRDKNEIERIQEDILNNPNIENNNNIILFTSDQFLDFLNLNMGINKWNSNKEDIYILKEEIKIVQEYKKNLKIIEDLLNSDVKFEELINKVSKLSDSYKINYLNYE